MKIIFLAGSGRSGTTWVANVINHGEQFRLMFEPFNPRKVKMMKSFRYRQYLRPDDKEERFLVPVRRLLFGEVESEWIDSGKQDHGTKGRLIKDIRINHLLKWLKISFPKIFIVLLLRHPCAVVASKLALGWETHLDEFLSQADLMSDYLEPFRKEMESTRSDVGRHALMWCIENYVPLHQFESSSEVYTAFYEDLCLQPRRSFSELFSFLGVPFNDEVFKSVETPFMTRKGSAILSGVSLTGTWKKQLSEEQVAEVTRVVNLFDLAGIYDEAQEADSHFHYRQG